MSLVSNSNVITELDLSGNSSDSPSGGASRLNQKPTTDQPNASQPSERPVQNKSRRYNFSWISIHCKSSSSQDNGW